MNYNDIKDKILYSNTYLTLASTNKNGEPWASPLSFIFDGEENFYFISSEDARHSQNIFQNPLVSFAIFDSSQNSGNTFWIQGMWIATKVDADAVPAHIKTGLFSLVSMVVLNRKYSFFCVHIEEMYLPHVERWKEDKPLRILIMGKNSENKNQD